MASIQFTSADRDDQGFVKAPAPRSLVDLLPKVVAPTTPTIQRRPPTKAELAALGALALLGAFLLVYLWSGAHATSAPVARPTAYIVPTAAPTRVASPTATPAPMLGAFAAPDGARLGSIEADRPMTATGHFNADWVQADVQGSGRIWLRAKDVPAMRLAGPNLAQLAADTAPAIEDAALAALNDPAQNGNNLAPPGCPFPIINGVCGNGARAKDVPDVPARTSIKASR